MAWLQYLVFLVALTLLVPALGAYLDKVFNGGRTWCDPVLEPCERLFYKILRVDPDTDMSWSRYARFFALFTVLSIAFLSLVTFGQRWLPLYGRIKPVFLSTPVSADLAFNIAASFATTTTWQAYGGESTLSYLTQTLALTSQSFLAGALGLGAGIAFMRGLAKQQGGGIGNFWRDLVRALLWVLLPLALFGSLFLVSQGVPMNLDPYVELKTLQGGPQVIAMGPVAALEFIKNLGTNGGGFFNTNGAHPFANPTPLTNMVGMLAIVVLPAALTYTFGRMVKKQREGWMLYAVMVALFVAGLTLCDLGERQLPPAWRDIHTTGETNMEGKEVRFGLGQTVLTTVVTSNAATGSSNAMLDSFTPLGSLVPLVNMLLGELVFGGLGSGFFSMIFIVLVALFLGSLMAGRIPEYLGKRLGPAEIKLVVLYSLVGPGVILPLTALAVGTEVGRAGLGTNLGVHGFSEIIFAYTSSFANNGLALAGLNGNTPWYNLTTPIAMLAGRLGLVSLALALAGSFARQSPRPSSSAALPTSSLTFAMLLLFTIVIVTGLSFLPALVLGPIAEHMQMAR